MPAFDLALRLRVVGRSSDMIHAVIIELFSEFTRDITGTVVRSQSWFVQDRDLITTGSLQG